VNISIMQHNRFTFPLNLLSKLCEVTVHTLCCKMSKAKRSTVISAHWLFSLIEFNQIFMRLCMIPILHPAQYVQELHVFPI
jgi:hypothetical protein